MSQIRFLLATMTLSGTHFLVCKAMDENGAPLSVGVGRDVGSAAIMAGMQKPLIDFSQVQGVGATVVASGDTIEVANAWSHGQLNNMPIDAITSHLVGFIGQKDVNWIPVH